MTLEWVIVFSPLKINLLAEWKARDKERRQNPRAPPVNYFF